MLTRNISLRLAKGSTLNLARRHVKLKTRRAERCVPLYSRINPCSPSLPLFWESSSFLGLFGQLWGFFVAEEHILGKWVGVAYVACACACIMYLCHCHTLLMATFWRHQVFPARKGMDPIPESTAAAVIRLEVMVLTMMMTMRTMIAGDTRTSSYK